METYPDGYMPGSEQERQRLADAARERDAEAELARVKELPEPEEAAPPVPGLSASERAELEYLRAKAGNAGEPELVALDPEEVKTPNRPFSKDQ
jgi:hypothetical protein